MKAAIKSLLLVTCVWVGLNYLSSGLSALLTLVIPASRNPENEIAAALRGISTDFVSVAAVLDSFLLSQPQGAQLRKKFLEFAARESGKHHGVFESWLDTLLAFYSAAAPFALLLLVTRYYGQEPPIVEKVAGVHPRVEDRPPTPSHEDSTTAAPALCDSPIQTGRVAPRAKSSLNHQLQFNAGMGYAGAKGAAVHATSSGGSSSFDLYDEDLGATPLRGLGVAAGLKTRRREGSAGEMGGAGNSNAVNGPAGAHVRVEVGSTASGGSSYRRRGWFF